MKVAAYCRVSTDQEDQVNSFESQQRYFRDYVCSRPDWELYEIYADEGITGTSTERRTAFQRMIGDAKQGRFGLIVTKEVSRFSRNILDTIAYTRQLRQLGVGVLFMNDAINTLEPDAELRLSIMGSIAQEESRKTSDRVKWGQTRRMEQGVVFGRSLLGYDVAGGRMTVNPQGAEIVRLIFHKYVHERKGTTVIARELREAGYQTLTGSPYWRSSVVLKILRNEKYCGDLKQKKTYTPDYLTHQKKYNHGQEAFVFLRNHHAPIVSRLLWEQAQRELDRRNIHGRLGAGHGSRYPLSGKIKCGLCGQSFISRTRTRTDGSRYKTWRCGTATAEGKRHTDPAGHVVGCDIGFEIRDQVGLEAVRRAVSTLKLDTDALVQDVTRIVMESARISGDSSQACVQRLKTELERLKVKKTNVLDAFLTRSISEADMKLMNGEYDRRISELTEKIRVREGQTVSNDGLEQGVRTAVWDIISGRNTPDLFYSNLLDRITAYPGRCLTVKLKLLPYPFRFELERQTRDRGDPKG